MIIELIHIESEAQVKLANDFNLDKEYIGEYEGRRYLGKFVRHTVAEIPELTSWNLMCDSTLFPNGIPFNSFDGVWEVNYEIRGA